MDYLNSLDLDTTNKRSHRMRSWYLYEQYKSLERNQLDAAKRLKDKSYQEKILRQELFERKARRKLYDQYRSCPSELGKESTKSIDNKTTLSVSADDFFESFCELHEDEDIANVTSSEDTFSQDDSVVLKSFTEDFKSVEDPKDDNSYAGSVKSVIENIKSIDHVDNTLMEPVISNNLNLQLEEAKENIDCIEKLIALSDIEKDSLIESDLSIIDYKRKPIGTVNRKSKKENNNLFAIWSRLVSFAYQIIKINHGNCYYDYSSQFLTAVLACDVLRRGISKMCNILQPYVSPIKFATDDESERTGQDKNVKGKLKQTKKLRKKLRLKNLHRVETSRKHHLAKKYWSEDCWHQKSESSLQKLLNENKSRWASEPWRSRRFTANIEDSDHSSCSSIWPELSKENIEHNNSYGCACCKRFRNPMLKIAQYIDNILTDLGDCY